MPEGKDPAMEAMVTGERLSALTRVPEWEEFMKICEAEYDACMRRMMVGSPEEVWQGRGGVNSIDRILSTVKSRIAHGDKVRQRIFSK